MLHIYSDSIRIFKDQIQADDNNLCFVYFTSPSKSIIKNRFDDVCLGFVKSTSINNLKKITTEDTTPFILHTDDKEGIEIILTPTYHAQRQITINDEDAYEEDISAPYYSKEFLKESIELSNKQLINAINLIKKLL